MYKNRCRRTGALAVLATTVGIVCSPQVCAQKEPSSEVASTGAIEEVIVTARRREESLQETPIAITAISGGELRERGITRVTELTKSVPSLHIGEGHANHIFLRGVGESNGFARIDPPVGFYLDDVFLPRTDSQLMDTVDIQSIQVLRGPQGTLFGKNTTGGAVVLTLEKPHDQFEGYWEIGLANYNQRRARIGANIPIADRLYARIAGNFIKDDGFLKDVNGSRSSSNDRSSLILQTRWDATDDLRVDSLLFYGRKRERFPGFNCTVNDRNALFIEGLFVQWPGDTDPSRPSAWPDNCEKNSRDAVGDLRTNMGDATQHLDHEMDDFILGLTLDWNYHDDHTLKVIAGGVDTVRGPILIASNSGGPEIFHGNFATEDSNRRSLTLEFQASGTAFNNRLNYAAGLFGMRERIDETDMSIQTLVGLDGTTLAALGQQEQPSRPPPGGTTPFVGIFGNAQSLNSYDLDNTTLAAYSQVSYDITENLQLTMGVRYTQETRETDWKLFRADHEAINQRLALHPRFGPPVATFNPFLGAWAEDPVRIAQDLFPDTTGDGLPNYPIDFVNPFLADRRKETFRETTPMASLSYHLPSNWLPRNLDTVMTYATWSNGFKSGMFEPLGVDGLQNVEPETIENREIGIKMDAFQRSLRFNAAAYSMLFDDQQLLQLQSDSAGDTTNVIFTNVGKSEIEGIELELQWVPFPGWMANLSYSNNNYQYTEYDDFDLVAKAVEQRDVLVDRTDEPFQFSPERTLAAGVQVAWDTVVGTFVPRMDVSYKSDMYMGFDRGAFEAFRRDTELAGQPAFTLVDLRLSWTDVDEETTVAAFIKNATDKRYRVGVISVQVIGTFNQVYGDPRRYGLEVRRKF